METFDAGERLAVQAQDLRSRVKARRAAKAPPAPARPCPTGGGSTPRRPPSCSLRMRCPAACQRARSIAGECGRALPARSSGTPSPLPANRRRAPRPARSGRGGCQRSPGRGPPPTPRTGCRNAGRPVARRRPPAAESAPAARHRRAPAGSVPGRSRNACPPSLSPLSRPASSRNGPRSGGSMREKTSGAVSRQLAASS